MKSLDVRLYSDSLAMPRLDIVSNDERYISLLRDWWFNQNKERKIDLLDRSSPSNTIVKLFQQFKQDQAYFGKSGDVLILHCGICDCAPRPIPLWLRNIISNTHPSFQKRIIEFIHKNRAKIQNTGFQWREVNKEDYRHYLEQLISEAVDNFERIYIFDIAPTNRHTNLHSPGFYRSIQAYNKVLNSVVQKINKENIYLIKAGNKIRKDIDNIDRYILHEDGHHLTPFSHRLYAEEIIKLEKSFYNIH